MQKFALAIPLILLTACAVRQPPATNWRFASRTLMPPGVASPDLAERAFTVRIAVRSDCLQSDALTITRRRSVIRVTVHREALLRQPRGWLAEWIDRAESQGCLPAGQGSLLAARILEALPLPSGAALRLMRADGTHNYVALMSGNRLRVVSPILRRGAAPAAEDASPMKVTAGGANSITVEMKAPPDPVGFETAIYEIQ